MTRFAILFVVVASSFGFSAQEGKCPDLSGWWNCRLFINGGEEPIFTSIKIEQDVVGRDSANYEIGGTKLSARWDQETVVGKVKTRCINESTLMSWYEENGVPYQRVFSRLSKTQLRNDIIRLQPSYFEHNQTQYVCELAP